MAIEKMKRLRLVAVRSQRDLLLEKLMVLGCVQVTESTEPDEGDELFGVLAREKAGYLDRRSDCEILKLAVALLDKYAPVKTKLLDPKPATTGEALLDDSTLADSLELAKKLDVTDDRIKRLEAEESHIRGQMEGLAPWKALDVPFEVKGTKTCFLLLGTIPVSYNMKQVRSGFDQGCDDAELFEISSDSEMHYVLLIAMRDREPEVMDAVRQYGFSPSSVSEMEGTATENLARYSGRLKEVASEKERLTAEIVAAASERDDLKLCADRMSLKEQKAQNAEKALYTRSTFTFEGWIPAAEEKKLAKTLEAFDCAWETEEPDSDKPEEVPIKLKNNPATKPMTMITEMYSLPAYNGVDPNPFLMPSFALFIGIMFADIGYGLILLLAGLLIKYRKKADGTMGYFGGIGIITGISCIIFGVVTGTFFGDVIPQLSEFFTGTPVNIPVLFDPLAEPMTVLVICLGIGVVHLLLGTAINGYMLIRDGQWFDALCDVGSIWLTFAGVALGALGVTWYVAIAGALAVVLATGRDSKSIGGKIGSGLWGLYNFVTGWFGDILSYSRLMALMLAGTVIASVFNTLGVMTGSIIAFAFIFLVGHALNFGLNIIGTYVHASRLEYLEFFGKFYREGGKPFEPLSLRTEYYRVSNN